MTTPAISPGCRCNSLLLAVAAHPPSQRRLHAAFRTFVVLCLLAAAAAAQERSAPPVENDTVVLSPFVVPAKPDTGYAASTTLAGTRLNTPVTDVGAAISIYTRDFLDDIAATNTESLLVYATGLEVGGVNGNFSAANVGSDFAGTDGARDSPQFATRVRGLSSATLTRNYYLSQIPFDSYNTSQITVNRGPNSVLFGLGSPGGIVDHGLKQPTGRNQAQMSFRFDSEGSSRASLDVDRVLIPRKLSVRINALYEDERFQQKPAFDRDTRVHGAVSYTPFRRTVLRAHAETGLVRANRPNPLLALDSISPWLAAGKPLFDFAAFDADPGISANGRAPLVSINPSPVNTFLLFYDQPDRSAPSASGRSQIAGAQQTAVSPINRDGQPETYVFLFTHNFFNQGSNRRYQSFTPENAAIFDWNRRMFEGHTSFQNGGFDNVNVALEQRTNDDRFGLELSGNWERFRQKRYHPFANRVGSSVYVDLNTTLPNGRPNPNVGRPFLFTGAVNRARLDVDRETVRATGYARFDFEKDTKAAVGRWLGRHTLTGLAESYGVESLNASDKLVLAGEAGARLFGLTERPQQRQPNRIVYVGPSLLGARSAADVRLEPLNVPIWTPGLSVPVEYFDPATQTVRTEPHTVKSILNQGTASREEIDSVGLILQSHWLRDHLVTLFGWRRDRSSAFVRSVPPESPGDPAGNYTYEGFAPPSVPSAVASGRLWTSSVVLKMPRRWLRGGRGVSDLSVFFNRSSNFQADTSRIDYLGRQLSPPEGGTSEVGLNLHLFERKLALRWNWYKTTAAGATYNNLVRNASQSLLFQLAGTWEQDRNNGIDRSAEVARLFQGVPENIKALYGYRINTSPNGVLSYESRIPDSLTDTANSVARGHEIEVVYNPTASWRMLLNVAKQDTALSKIAPVARAFVEMMSPNWVALANAPAGTALNVDRSRPETYETVAARVERLLYVPLRTLQAQEGTQALEQRIWRCNLVANYSFREGPLKGWSAGSGVRWQDKANIGYIIKPQPDGSAITDLRHPLTSPPQLNIDAWLGYERRLGKKVRWRMQVNAKNLQKESAFQPVVTQPETGAVAQYRIPNSRLWYVTNTFTF